MRGDVMHGIWTVGWESSSVRFLRDITSWGIIPEYTQTGEVWFVAAVVHLSRLGEIPDWLASQIQLGSAQQSVTQAGDRLPTQLFDCICRGASQ